MIVRSLFLLLLAAIAAAKQVDGVFTALDSILQDGSNSGKFYDPWVATLKWKILGSEVAPGDTFHLTLDCVFRAKSSIDLVSDSTVVAKCVSTNGYPGSSDSSIDCTAVDAVQPNGKYSGTMSFRIFPNVGFSGLSSDTQCAQSHKVGKNTITMTDGSNTISNTFTINKGIRYNQEPGKIVYDRRSGLYNYLMAGNCDDGYTSATLGIEITDGADLDCDTAAMHVSNQINLWYFPETAANPDATISCKNNKLTVTFSNINAGYRPYINVQNFRINGDSVSFKYTDKYLCKGSDTEIDNSISRTFTQTPIEPPDSSGEGSNEGQVITTTVTRSVPAITTTTIVPTTSGGTTTIEIIVPPPPEHITTTTVTGSVPAITTTTIVPTTSGGTTTIEIIVPPPPEHITTTTVTGSVPAITTTTIVPTTSGGTTTIEIIVPPPPEHITTTTIAECPICSCYDSVVSTIDTNGKPTTETVSVIVTTNLVGSLFTSVSRELTTKETLIVTAYVTTCVATLPGGVVATSTASVVVATNSQGSTYTKSEIIGRTSTIPGQISFYVTTYLSSNSNSVLTKSHEVVVATNSVGSTYTTGLQIGNDNTGVGGSGNQEESPSIGPKLQNSTPIGVAPHDTAAGISTGAVGPGSTNSPLPISFSNTASSIRAQFVFAFTILTMLLAV